MVRSSASPSTNSALMPVPGLVSRLPIVFGRRVESAINRTEKAAEQPNEMPGPNSLSVHPTSTVATAVPSRCRARAREMTDVRLSAGTSCFRVASRANSYAIRENVMTMTDKKKKPT